MRIGLGDIAPPNAADCLSYQCGADPANIAARYACAIAGFSAVKSCDDPTCEPYCPNQQLTPYLQPPYQPPATPSAPAAPTIILTPQSIVQPFPDITRTLQPVILAPQCNAWDELNAAIADHPILSIAAASLAYYLFARKKR